MAKIFSRISFFFSFVAKFTAMIRLETFTFNPFAENTYLLYGPDKSALIFDPGCYYGHERKVLQDFIQERGLKIQALVNTHCHLDHVFGNAFIAQTYGVQLHAHQGEQIVLDALPLVAKQYGIPNVQNSPKIEVFLQPDQIWEPFAKLRLKILWLPGHSPASLGFYLEEQGILISGDVLFQNSIGRTDLPGGDYPTLMHSIKTQILPLPADTQIYSGHGPQTTLGEELKYNPFLKQ